MADYEDAFFRLQTENGILKKKLSEQDEKMKQMGTKLQRIHEDIRREREYETITNKGGKKRDIEVESYIEDLRQQLTSERKEREKLTRTVALLKNTANSLKINRSNARPKVDTGISKKLVPLQTRSPSRLMRSGTLDQSIIYATEDVSQQQQQTDPKDLMNILISNPTYNLGNEDHNSLQEVVRLLTNLYLEQDKDLKESKSDSDNLRQELAKAKEETNHAKAEITQLKIDEVRLKEEIERKEKNSVPKSREEQLQNQLLDLQKELRDKTAKLSNSVKNMETSESMLAAIKENHTALLEQTTLLNNALKDEKKKTLSLEQEIKAMASNSKTFQEFDLIIGDLREEKKKLEEIHNKLKASIQQQMNEQEKVFDKERNKYKERVQDLESRMAALEDDLQKQMKVTRETLDKLDQQRADNDKLRKEKSEIQIKLFETQQKVEELNSRLSFFTSDGGVDIGEIHQALAYVRLKKSGAIQDTPSDVDKLTSHLEEMRVINSELKSENEKVVKMLQIQEDINRDLKQVTEDLKNEIRSNAVVKFEEGEESEATGVDDNIPLQEDENVFELQLISGNLNINFPSNIDTFVSFDFYEHEPLISPVITGLKPMYNLTARFIVKIEDFLLYYFKYYTLPLELHQSQGLDFLQLGHCHVNLRELEEKSGKIFGSTDIISVDDNITVIGNIQYSIRLWKPINEAVKMWKAKMAALSLLDEPGTSAHQRQIASSQIRNELVFKVLNCKKLVSRTVERPAVFVMYQFYEYPEQDTQIVTSLDPIFNHTQSYNLVISNDLEEYLLTQKIEFAVFDDNDTRGDFFFGVAEVSLISLIHDKMIRGEFSIKDKMGEVTGILELEIYWRNPYTRLSLQNSRTPSLPRSSLLLLDSGLNTSQKETKDSMKLSISGSKDSPVKKVESNQDSKRSVMDSKSSSLRSSKPLPTIPQKPAPSPIPVASEEEASSGLDSQKDPLFAISLNKPDDFVKSGKRYESEIPTSSEEPLSMSELDQPRSIKNKGKTKSNRTQPVKKTNSKRSVKSFVDDSVDSEVIVKPKEAISIIIEKLELEPNILAKKDIEKIFVSYEFLRYPIRDLETIALPKDQNPFIYNFTRVFPVEPNRYKLYTLMTSDIKREANIEFVIFNEKATPENASKVQCIQIGTAIINLQKLLEFSNDLESQDIMVFDRHLVKIGTLFISVVAVEALDEVLKAARKLEKSSS